MLYFFLESQYFVKKTLLALGRLTDKHKFYPPPCARRRYYLRRREPFFQPRAAARMTHPLAICPTTPELRPAEQQPVPWSATFNDRYWSTTGDPCAEAETVFIAANRLRERWRQMPPGSAFHIAEIGFGTGLNFLCVWRLWQQLRRPGCRLHYLGLDLAPLHTDAMLRAHAGLSVADLSRQLAAAQLPVTGGVHRLLPEPGSVWLTLAIGDAHRQLSAMLADSTNDSARQAGYQVDCWFMDGFAPAQNPSAWSPALAASMAGLSHGGTTLSSYSVAGSVRDALGDAGFAVTKQPGHGGKRHRLEAQMRAAPTSTASSKAQPSALIVGAGLAGSAAAEALALRGCTVTLLHESRNIASANPAALLHPRLSAGADRGRLHWNLSGWALAMRQLARSATSLSAWRASGVLQQLASGKSLRRAERLVALRALDDLWRLCDAEDASQIAGVRLQGPQGYWMHYPDAGWCDMGALCAHLQSHRLIAARAGDPVQRVERRDGGWTAVDERGSALATGDICVLATAGGGELWPLCAGELPRYRQLAAVRGQMDCLRADQLSQGLQLPLAGNSCLLPAVAGGHWVGASRRPGFDDSGPNASETERNRRKALALLGGDQLGAGEPVQSWAAHRWQHRDGLPTVGAVTTGDGRCAEGCSDGLYISAGMGSRGLTFAFLAAELLAAQIFAEPLPLSAPAALAAKP